MAKVPSVKLNNGNEIPIFGLGTWKSKPGEVTQAVIDAIDAGYRHIDGAHVYQNEKEVGAGVKNRIDAGVVKREDLFLTSKLWNTYHKPEQVEPALKVTLNNLGVNYVDLYLIHWPMAFKEGDDLFPTSADGKIIYSDADFVNTWKAMEAVHKKGLAKNIGISNFNKRQIEKLLASASVVPATNQIEVHPYLNQKKLMEFCKTKGITITAYSPLGSPDRPWAKPGDPKLTEDPKIVAIAKKYNKTPAQVIIKWNVQRGNITIPKSVTKARIIENLQIWDFNLTADDVAQIDTFDCKGRICGFDNPNTLDHKDHPFSKDEF